MALRINVLQYSRFVFRLSVITFIVGKTGPMHLVLVGLTADWQAVRRIQVDFKIFKILYMLNFWDFYFI